MPLYTREDFDSSLIPNGFKKDIEQVVTVAVALGWKLHIGTKPPSMTIIAPGEKKKYHFGYNWRRGSANLNRVKRDLFRFGDPTLVAIADQLIDGKMPDEMLQFIPLVGNDNTTVETPEEVHTVKKAH